MPQHTDIESRHSEAVLEIDLKALGKILIRHFRLHDGIYEVGARFKVGIGNFGSADDGTAPGALFTLEGVGISKSGNPSPSSIDAAVVNPAPAAVSVPAKRPTRRVDTSMK